MAWVRALGIHHARCIQARGFRMEMHLKEGIPGAERPSIRYFPFGIRFQTSGSAVHFVIKRLWED